LKKALITGITGQDGSLILPPNSKQRVKPICYIWSNRSEENKMKPKKRRIFDKEFKQRIVELIKQGDKKVKEVALDLGFFSVDVYCWMRE